MAEVPIAAPGASQGADFRAALDADTAARLAEWRAYAAAVARVEFVRGRRERWLNLSRQPPEQKRGLWARLQAERPALAALLQDPVLRALCRAFEAEILVERLDDDDR